MTKKKVNPEPEVPTPNQNDDRYWSFTIGFYPGILFGFRTYEEKDFSTHVMYLPFIDFAIEIDR
jgi:hypothetical protein